MTAMKIKDAAPVQDSRKQQLLEDETKFWFDGKPSGLMSALCKTQKISQEEADKIREMLNGLDG